MYVRISICYIILFVLVYQHITTLYYIRRIGIEQQHVGNNYFPGYHWGACQNCTFEYVQTNLAILYAMICWVLLCTVTFPLTFLDFLLQGRDPCFQFNNKVSNRIWVFNNNLVVAVLPSGTPVEIELFVVHFHVECCINLHETCMSNSSNGRPIHWFHLVPSHCGHWEGPTCTFRRST